MKEYLERYQNLKEDEKKQVMAAAQWGDGPFTRKVFSSHFPKINPDDVPKLISHLKAIKAS